MPEEATIAAPAAVTPSPAPAASTTQTSQTAPPPNATPDGSGALPSTLVSPPSSGKVTEVDFSKSKVTFDDFLKKKDGIESSDEKKADNSEGQKPTDTSADKLDTQEPAEDPNINQPTAGKKQIQEILNSRDYSGIDPNDIPHFKRMSNDAFAYLKPIYTGYKKAQADLAERETQIKELSSGREVLPPSYYENPEAVVLSPAFKQVSQVYQQAKYEEGHWAQQLENVEMGNPIYDLVVKDGQLVQSAPIEVTDENRGKLKAAVLNAFTTAKSAATAEYGKIQDIVGNFKAKNAEITNWVKSQEDKFFPQFKDEKFPGWTFAKELQSSLPRELQGNLILPLASKMYAVIRMQQEKIAQMTAEQQKKTSIAEDAVKAGPNSGSFTGGQVGKPAITYDMFQKLKESVF